MNLDYTLTDQEGQLTLPDVPEKASSLWLPGIQAWQKFIGYERGGAAS